MLPLRSLRARLILAFLVTVLLPLIGTGLYGNWTTSRTLEAQALDNARADLRLRARQIETYLGGVREDLLFLSRLDSLAVFLACPETCRRVASPTQSPYEASNLQSLISNLQSDFAAFAATHPDVFQTRYLDATGMEVVRVDSTSSGLVTVPAHRLQNKADRYYFSATMQLAAGQVYISPVDLNREFGVIQAPHVPTIRYATPVFHPDGSRAGIVILNLYAEPFLRFARADAESDALLALADHSGWYLAHPDPAREWGGPNDLDTGAGAADDYPLRWPVIAGGASGVYAPPPENWWAALVEEVLPVGLFDSADSDTRRVLVYETVWANTGSGPHWHLLRDEPRVHFFAAISLFRLTAITILTAAALTALAMAVGLARSLTAPILTLTEDVRRFGQDKLARRPTQKAQAPPGARDEIGELAAAFAEMSAAINHHLEQLSLLNRAGHHITARLERPAVLEASARAATTLLPAGYCAIQFDSESGVTMTHAAGDARWAAHRSDPALTALLNAATADDEWRTAALPGDAHKPSGYFCAAPLCVSGRPGFIGLYGEDPVLADAASGNLLATLAVQISIALENAALYERLAERRAELQALVEQLINAQEEERRLVAYDIHDGLIQMLVGARLQLGNALADRESDPERAGTTLKKGLDELAAAIAEARRVIEGLRPATLDDLGLVTTLRQFAEESLAACDCQLEFIASPPDLSLPPPVEITAFRIAQEAITNARKYSATQRLRVALTLNSGALTVKVRDWGHGFNPEAVTEGRGMGLTGMRERARLLGGECLIESAPGAGTTVKATLPLPATNH
jgi:signal transduction histidine kinase